MPKLFHDVELVSKIVGIFSGFFNPENKFTDTKL